MRVLLSKEGLKLLDPKKLPRDKGYFVPSLDPAMTADTLQAMSRYKLQFTPVLYKGRYGVLLHSVSSRAIGLQKKKDGPL